MKTTLHKANTRGAADHGWLKSHHTFSFANYFDQNRMGFGVLRVINDDVVSPGKGFGTHSHKNMEIISIPLRGSLKHKDTMGSDFVIKKGEIQIMTAGTGVSHSEYNNSAEEDVNFLQIWVLPKKHDITPNYSQKEFAEEKRENQFQLVASPDGRQNSVEMNQDAFFSLSKLDKGENISYSKYLSANGVYVFLLEGELSVNDQALSKRDGLGIEGAEKIEFQASRDSEVLVMEIPM